MRPPVHIPEPAMMMHDPRIELMALDSSTDRTSWRPPKSSGLPTGSLEGPSRAVRGCFTSIEVLSVTDSCAGRTPAYGSGQSVTSMSDRLVAGAREQVHAVWPIFGRGVWETSGPTNPNQRA